MPKRRVLAYSLDPNQPGDEFLFNLLIAPVAIVVNLAASLPGAVRALFAGRLHSRVPATLLIAIGGIVAGTGDTLSRFGVTSLFQSGKFIGVLFLFAGFLVSIEVFRTIRIPFTSIIARGGAPRIGGRHGARRDDGRSARHRRRPDRPARRGIRRRLTVRRVASVARRRPTMARCRQTTGRARRRRRPTSTQTPTAITPAIGFIIVLGAATLFGTLGPLSRFAYDAGMEPAAFVAWRALIGVGGTLAFVVWRLGRGSVRLVHLGSQPRRVQVTLFVAGVTGFTLNLCMFIAFDRITVALALLGFYTYPALVAIANVALGRERLDTAARRSRSGWRSSGWWPLSRRSWTRTPGSGSMRWGSAWRLPPPSARWSSSSSAGMAIGRYRRSRP